MKGLEPAVARELEVRRAGLDALLQNDVSAPGPRAQALGEMGRLYHAHGLAAAAMQPFLEQVRRLFERRGPFARGC